MDDFEAAVADPAGRVRGFLEENREDRSVDFPFPATFPTNACEGTSCLLAYILEPAFGLENVTVVEGHSPADAASHLWVEAGGRIYDLTADQFAGAQVVLPGSAQPMGHAFSETRPVPVRRYCGRDDAEVVLRRLSWRAAPTR